MVTGITPAGVDTKISAAVASKADLVGGLVPSSQLPAIALTTAVPVADQAAMLALTASQVQPGDVAVRADGAGSFILIAAPASSLGNWLRLNAPTDVVTSVAGRNGVVVLGKGDVGLPLVDNTPDSAKPVSGPQADALALKADTSALAAKADVSALAGKADTSALAAKADLVNGVVPTSQIPALALTDTVTVASQAAMLALTSSQVQPGDVAVRTDGAGSFILKGTDPSVLGNWVRLNAPSDAVGSVNGQTGTVVLAASDVGAAPASAATGAGTFIVITGFQVVKTANVQGALAELDAGAVDYDQIQVDIAAVGAAQRVITDDLALRIASLENQLLTAGAGANRIVRHGTTASTARPTGTLPVEWRGTVTPTNAANGDTYRNTDTDAVVDIVITADTTPPAVPSFSLTAGDATLTALLGIPADSDFHHNEVRYGTTNPPTAAPINVGTQTSVTLSGVTNGTTYYAQARSVDAVGNASAWTAVATATPAAPTNNQIVTDGLLARWDFNALLTGNAGDPVPALTEPIGGYQLSPGATQPVVVAVGSKKGVSFDGVDDFLQNSTNNSPYLTVSQPNTIIAVGRFRTATPASKPFIYSQSNVAGSRQIINSSSTGAWQANAGVTLGSGVNVDTVGHAVAVRFNGASSAITIDGTTVKGDMGTAGLAGLRLAYNSAGNAWGAVDMYEVLVYNRALTDAEIASTVLGLRQKWGLA